MDKARCFMVAETGTVAVGLRRFTFEKDAKCPGRAGAGGHDATVEIGEQPAVLNAKGYIDAVDADVYAGDQRWPAGCESCGYQFTEADHRQVSQHRMYTDGTQRWPLRQLPPGAMYDKSWKQWYDTHPDGHSYAVVCPDGSHWSIDSKAKNCNDTGRPHQCWVRHGTVPDLTVDKGEPGESCTAGQGSIQTATWHGFLRGGELAP